MSSSVAAVKALYYRGSVGGLEWREDPAPAILAASDALVRPIAASTCDLDQAIVHSTVPGAEQPFAIGHEAVGEVLEVGAAVTRLRRGDLVVIPYHLSCGACDRCREDLPLFCRETAAEALAVYGVPVGAEYGGLFSELVRVPFADHGLVKLPPSVSPLDAVSVGDNLTDAYRAIAPRLRARPGSDVLILSAGSIGLYAADIARAYGAGVVRYVDASAQRRGLAAEFGAEVSAPEDFDPGERGYPVSLVTHGSVDALRDALLAAGPGGEVENLGFHFADVALPVAAMHFKCVTFRSAMSNARPLIPEVLALVASGRISPRRVQTAVLPFDEAADALPRAGFKPVFVRDPINLD
jgi:threonine dehydrogenase-like Zn-dependent dehydrogenase